MGRERGKERGLGGRKLKLQHSSEKVLVSPLDGRGTERRLSMRKVPLWVEMAWL